jgi:nucleoside-diphosphate-sugar epimerase
MNKLTNIIAEDAEKICNQVDLSEIQGKKILITGASGLMGVYFLACLCHLSSALKGSFGVNAIVQSAPSAYLADFLNYPGVSVFRGDLTNPKFCEDLPQADYIIHAAGYGQPGRFMENPIKTLQLNTSTTFLMFEKLLPQGKFLFISTSEVYSGLATPPYKESEIGTSNTTHPRACYIEAKRCGEAICNAYRAKGVAAKSARLSLAYGPGTRKGDLRVMNSFIQKALNGQITLLDQGMANRTYCYVSDAVERMWNILLFGKEPVYNVGGNSRITIGELALTIGKYLNVPVIFPTISQDMIGAPDDVYLDMTKVRNEFGKADFIAFDEGLARTIEWQKVLYSSSEEI